MGTTIDLDAIEGAEVSLMHNGALVKLRKADVAALLDADARADRLDTIRGLANILALQASAGQTIRASLCESLRQAFVAFEATVPGKLADTEVPELLLRLIVEPCTFENTETRGLIARFLCDNSLLAERK